MVGHTIAHLDSEKWKGKLTIFGKLYQIGRSFIPSSPINRSQFEIEF